MMSEKNRIRRLMKRNNLAVSSGYLYTTIQVGSMKSKKGIVSFIFILLCAAAIFVIGWVQLYVPVESYGVLVSKTNGVDPQVIRQGEITWKWQRLLPTNTVIHIFEAKNEKNFVTISGKLPSADIYSALIEGRPDFSYSLTFEIESSVKPELLPSLVKERGITGNDDLSALLSKAADDAAGKAAQYLLDSLTTETEGYVSLINDEKGMLEAVTAASTSSDAVVSGIKVTYSKLPDLQLYNVAKTVYTAYLEGVKDALLETTGSQIGLASDDFLLIERFGKLGKVLTEYPVLIDYLAVTRDDPEGALGLLNILRKTE